MSQRFHIEDLVVQDRSGVVFQARDTETGQTVAIRRFFPFGPNGGGLEPDEQAAYASAVQRLSAIAHPALRAVICGGCDPVDGMPYIATEWVEGPRLAAFIGRGPLSPAEATHLLGQALEISEVLSQVLAEEAVWIETTLESIVVGAESTGRGVTFWISPLKWLGKRDGQRGLDAIVTLAEEIMGWTGKSVPDQAGGGLGGWLKWLRGSTRTATLLETREKLAACGGGGPPVPTRKLVRQAKQAGAAKQRKSSVVPVFASAMVALLALGGTGWWFIRRNDARNAAATSGTAVFPEKQAAPVLASEPAVVLADSTEPAPVAGEMPRERANRLAMEISAAAQGRKARAADQEAEIARRGGVFTPADHDLLVAQDQREVTVEGVFEAFGYSKSRATMYLQFSKEPGRNEIRGSVKMKSAPQDLSETQLAPLIGKKVRMRGELKVEKGANTGRPLIVIDKRSAIQVVK